MSQQVSDTAPTKKRTATRKNKPAATAAPSAQLQAATEPAAKAKAAPVVDARPGDKSYTITLRGQHNDWLENYARGAGRSPEHQIEKFLREAYQADAGRASGKSVQAGSDAGQALAAEVRANS